MTAIAVTRDLEVRPGEILDHPVLADQVIYKGSPVVLDASSGYAQTNDGATITLATGDVFVGFADETVDATSVASGVKRINVRCKGVVTLTNIAGTVTQAKVGDPVYINNTSDNSGYTLTAASDGSDLVVGYLVDYISSTSGLVAIIAQRSIVGSNPDPDSSGLFGTGALLVAKMTYDFAVDGGVEGDIVPAVTPTIPDGAIVYQAITKVITAVTGVGASVAVPLQSANDIHTAAAISGAPWSTTGLKAATPVGTAATAILLTAARTPKVVVSGADLTAGKFTTYFMYMLA